jgi:uncharacterized glyoxalase superfamily protein PhnB
VQCPRRLLTACRSSATSFPISACDAGAAVLREPADQGHGERQSRLRDPFGHEWLLGHELEAVSPEEIKRRFETEHRA